MTATKYNTDVIKMIGNQAQPPVQAPVQMDVWLEEGAMTVNSRKTISDGAKMMDKLTWNIAYDSEFDDDPVTPNFVTFPVADDGYFYDALKGKPIVTTIDSAAAHQDIGIIGHMVGYAQGPVNLPAADADADTIDERIAGLYLRHAAVTLYGYAYVGGMVDGTSAVNVGDQLDYNYDTGYFQKTGGTSGAISCHYTATAAGASAKRCGILITGVVTVVT